MTQTSDQRARELLARQLEIGLYHDDAERVRAAQDGLGVICAASALAALTEALTRIDELEGALGFYASESRYQGANQRILPDDKWTDKDAVYRLDVTRDNGSIARATLSKGITE